MNNYFHNMAVPTSSDTQPIDIAYKSNVFVQQGVPEAGAQAGAASSESAHLQNKSGSMAHASMAHGSVAHGGAAAQHTTQHTGASSALHTGLGSASNSRLRRESIAHSQGIGGISWGSLTIGSWLKDEVMMHNNNILGSHNDPSTGSTKPRNNSIFNNNNLNLHSSHMSPPIQPSYLPDLEANYCKDYSCCGQLLPTLHDLLKHYEESHISSTPPAHQPKPLQNYDTVSTTDVFINSNDPSASANANHHTIQNNLQSRNSSNFAFNHTPFTATQPGAQLPPHHQQQHQHQHMRANFSSSTYDPPKFNPSNPNNPNNTFTNRQNPNPNLIQQQMGQNNQHFSQQQHQPQHQHQQYSQQYSQQYAQQNLQQQQYGSNSNGQQFQQQPRQPNSYHIEDNMDLDEDMDVEGSYIDDPSRNLYVAQGSEKPFTCPVIGCNKTYKNQNGLKYHRLHGHQNQKLHLNPDGTYSVIDPNDGNGMEQDKPYRCEVCGKRYKNLNGLKYHRGHSTH